MNTSNRMCLKSSSFDCLIVYTVQFVHQLHSPDRAVNSPVEHSPESPLNRRANSRKQFSWRCLQTAHSDYDLLCCTDTNHASRLLIDRLIGRFHFKSEAPRKMSTIAVLSIAVWLLHQISLQFNLLQFHLDWNQFLNQFSVICRRQSKLRTAG